MPSTTNFLAFDLGAESGRAVVGQFDGDRLTLTELHRFPNGPVPGAGPSALGRPAPLGRDEDRVWHLCQQYGSERWRASASTPGASTSPCSARKRRAARQPATTTATPAPTACSRQPFERRAARRDLRAHRHPVHAVQHALPAAVAMRLGESAAAGAGRDAADDARPVQLLVHRAQGVRVHQRHHHAVLRPARKRAGPSRCSSSWACPTGHPAPRSSRPARCSARCTRDIARGDRPGRMCR